jgi:AcrR family transcriptional regulator
MLRASLDVLAENGFASLSVERICARAGVPKATFYRRWSAPVDAVVDALKLYTRDFVLEDTGDLAADLFAYMKKIIAVHADPIIGVCRNFVASQARVRPDIAEPMMASGLIQLNRDLAQLDAILRRQGLHGGLSAAMILNAIYGVAFNTVVHTVPTWQAGEADMKALIAALLGRAND